MRLSNNGHYIVYAAPAILQLHAFLNLRLARVRERVEEGGRGRETDRKLGRGSDRPNEDTQLRRGKLYAMPPPGVIFFYLRFTRLIPHRFLINENFKVRSIE